MNLFSTSNAGSFQ